MEALDELTKSVGFARSSENSGKSTFNYCDRLLFISALFQLQHSRLVLDESQGRRLIIFGVPLKTNNSVPHCTLTSLTQMSATNLSLPTSSSSSHNLPNAGRKKLMPRCLKTLVAQLCRRQRLPAVRLFKRRSRRLCKIEESVWYCTNFEFPHDPNSTNCFSSTE